MALDASLIERIYKKHFLKEKSPITEEALRDFVKDLKDTSGEISTADYSESQMAGFFRQLINSLPDYIYFKDLKSRFIYCNPAHLQHLGLNNMEEAIGKSDADFFQAKFAKEKRAYEAKIMQSGEGLFFKEENHKQQDGSEYWALSTKVPLRDENGEICGLFGLSQEITEKKKIELELERQRVLLDTIIKILPCRLFVRDKDGKFLLVNEEYKKQLHIKKNEDIIGKTLSEVYPNDDITKIKAQDEAVISNGVKIINEIDYDSSLLTDKRWISTSKVPLTTKKGKVDGMVGITLDIHEQKTAEENARNAYRQLSEKTNQMEAELDVARNLQERLMAEGFKNDHTFIAKGKYWSISSCYLYQPSHHLAGDFFHLVPISKSKVGILICDVLGHGVKAALVTMLIRGILIEATPFFNKPAEVLNHLNKRLNEFAQDPQFPRFTTAIYLVVDLTAGKVHYANAGHPHPLFSFNGEEVSISESQETGCALGLLPDENYNTHSIPIGQIDRIALFSDGILELENKEEHLFEREGLAKALSSKSKNQLPEELDLFKNRLKKYSGSDTFPDDICLLVFDIAKRDRKD